VRLTLASQSPRRRELLEQLGISLVVRPAGADESARPGEEPRDYVRRVAIDKARAVEGEVVLAADTAVVLDTEVLGKPRDAEDAGRMLRALSGRTHEVLTGVCVRSRSGVGTAVASTRVRFAALSPSQIAWYVATGEPLDKAGAYAVQGAGGAFVVGLEGSVSNVIGLPLSEALELLHAAGFPLPWYGP